MKLALFRHLWGIDLGLEEAFPRIKAAGYDGVEAALPPVNRRSHFKDLLAAYELQFIPVLFTRGRTVAEHITSFWRQLEAALKDFEPVVITSRDGVDAWTEEQSIRYFQDVLSIEANHGVRVAHETQRGRILFHPWITGRLIERFEGLMLCGDFSHWVCVCERLLEDQAPLLERCAARTLHLHARVGYAQGPQVPDPRLPRYRDALAAHEHWWDRVWDAQERQGLATTTLTPEFGPPPYLHIHPQTGEPLADLWEVCDWMARRQADRFAARA
ncbi:hypothetical protein GQ464_005255 [Rhodocaloribacter litoris]|uniref:sugar phosphate isomerase/epimerase family protein n=1 Tax=Rhodocaloribacter litoris TaxID=2558931 RepID=UPI001422E36F|nr:sugar phosphate isomerase/epimerase [Rhodocaloribacter litoris]QXD16362.1 hypothetical protein GQ464_005255 [Rhodocaloribacter litoris]